MPRQEGGKLKNSVLLILSQVMAPVVHCHVLFLIKQQNSGRKRALKGRYTCDSREQDAEILRNSYDGKRQNEGYLKGVPVLRHSALRFPGVFWAFRHSPGY